MARVLIGTDDGIHELGPQLEPGGVQLPGHRVTALASGGSGSWAIVDRHEVWRSTGDDGWLGVARLKEGPIGRCLEDTQAGVIVGTSEAHLMRMAGSAFESVDGFERVEGRTEWYTPWGGPPDTRSISEDDAAVYANVHVGGIVRSLDQGDTWEPTIDIHADVHQVRATSGRVLAACARGRAVSEDRGDTWTMRTDGLHATYCRAVAVVGDTVLISASDGPRGGHGAVYRGRVDGGPLERCSEGLPDWFDDNVDSSWLDATSGLVAFATGDGHVFASDDEGTHWQLVASGLPAVHCLLAVP